MQKTFSYADAVARQSTGSETAPSQTVAAALLSVSETHNGSLSAVPIAGFLENESLNLSTPVAAHAKQARSGDVSQQGTISSEEPDIGGWDTKKVSESITSEPVEANVEAATSPSISCVEGDEGKPSAPDSLGTSVTTEATTKFTAPKAWGLTKQSYADVLAASVKARKEEAAQNRAANAATVEQSYHTASHNHIQSAVVNRCTLDPEESGSPAWDQTPSSSSFSQSISSDSTVPSCGGLSETTHSTPTPIGNLALPQPTKQQKSPEVNSSSEESHGSWTPASGQRPSTINADHRPCSGSQLQIPVEPLPPQHNDTDGCGAASDESRSITNTTDSDMTMVAPYHPGNFRNMFPVPPALLPYPLPQPYMGICGSSPDDGLAQIFVPPMFNSASDGTTTMDYLRMQHEQRGGLYMGGMLHAPTVPTLPTMGRNKGLFMPMTDPHPTALNSPQPGQQCAGLANGHGDKYGSRAQATDAGSKPLMRSSLRADAKPFQPGMGFSHTTQAGSSEFAASAPATTSTHTAPALPAAPKESKPVALSASAEPFTPSFASTIAAAGGPVKVEAVSNSAAKSTLNAAARPFVPSFQIATVSPVVNATVVVADSVSRVGPETPQPSSDSAISETVTRQDSVASSPSKDAADAAGVGGEVWRRAAGNRESQVAAPTTAFSSKSTSFRPRGLNFVQGTADQSVHTPQDHRYRSGGGAVGVATPDSWNGTRVASSDSSPCGSSPAAKYYYHFRQAPRGMRHGASDLRLVETGPVETSFLGHIYRHLKGSPDWAEWEGPHQPVHFSDNHQLGSLRRYLDGMENITDKVKMIITLGDLDFLPPSWVFKRHAVDRPLTSVDLDTSQDTSPYIWYLKSSADAKGEGIQLLYNPLDGVVRMDTDYILQKEIKTKDILEGYKSDWRVYVGLFYRGTEAKGYVYRVGLNRPCLHKYDLSTLDPTRHLTNRSVQAKEEDFSLDHYQLAAQKIASDPNCNGGSFEPFVYDQIKRIVRLSFERCEPYWRSWNDRGTLFMAYDLLVDPNNKVWLLETNGAPGLSDYGPYIRDILFAPMIADIVNQILLPASDVHELAAVGKWDLVYQTTNIDASGQSQWVRPLKPEQLDEPKVTVKDVLEGRAASIMEPWLADRGQTAETYPSSRQAPILPVPSRGHPMMPTQKSPVKSPMAPAKSPIASGKSPMASAKSPMTSTKAPMASAKAPMARSMRIPMK